MAENNDVFEIMSTTRSMRRLKPDPVPDDLIRKILHAGLGAANGGNTQKWRFMVLKDPLKKKAVQEWYKKAFDEVVGPRYASSAPPPGSDPAKYKRQHGAVEYLTDHYHEAPVWIVACLEDGPTPNRSAGASVYPAVQNMLLAIRALGLGSTLTTRHLQFEKETEAALGLPPGVHSYAILPIGYPMGKFGPTGRGKMSDFVYGDTYGQVWSGGFVVMARVPQIAGKADLPAEHQHVVDQVLEVFGRVRGPFSILLHSPDLAERLLPMVPFARKMTIVEAIPRFVGILATVREKGAGYVWAAQVRVAREAGLREAAIDVLRAKGDLSLLEPDEREVALYARQLVLTNHVDQPVFDALQKRMGTKWLVELTAIMSFYGALCGLVNAFEVPVPDDGDRF